MIEQTFTEFAEANGLPLSNYVPDGKIHRFKTPSDKGRNQSGWYAYHDSARPYAIIGSWKDDVRFLWRSKQSFEAPKDFAKRAAKQLEETKRAQAELKRTQLNAAQKAYQIYAQADAPACNNEYLKKKRIEAPAGVRQQGSDLVVPVHDTKQIIVSLQFISPDGSKRFLKGGKMQGGFFAIGQLTEWIYLCEGMATAVSIHARASSYAVACFNAGNLKQVALALKAKYPDCHFMVCADDDRHNSRNVGLDKAKAAALAVGGDVIKPEFCCADCDCSDFNDVANCPELKGARHDG